MGILRLTDSLIEYLLISSALLFLMGMISFFAVKSFRIKGAIKIFLYALVFVLPIIYPVRSLLPESTRISLELKSEYIEPLKNTETRNLLISDVPLPSGSEAIAVVKINHEMINIKGETSYRGVKEGLVGTASQIINNWKPFAAVTWLLIFSISLIRLITSINATKQLLQSAMLITEQRIIRLLSKCASDTGLHHIPQLYFTNGITSPMVMGFLKPVIVIPAHLLEEESHEGLRFALLHELKHIQQRHNLWLLIESVIGAVYFFHPVIHWAKRKIHEELENICDRHVINITHKKVTYADFLLNEIWQHNHNGYPALSLPFITTASKTANRIHSILDNKVVSTSIPAREMMAAFSVLAIFSSLMFFTIVPVMRVADVSQGRLLSGDSVKSNNKIPTYKIEQINASPVIRPIVAEKSIELHVPATEPKKEIRSNSIENTVKKQVKKDETASVKQVNAVADNTVPDKYIQPVTIQPEQSAQISDTHTADIDIIPLTGSSAPDISMEPILTPETMSQKYLGPPVNELTIYRIDDIRVLDEYTILFIMRSGEMYLSRLKDPCPALLYANNFKLDSTIGTISKFDRIKAISNGNIISSTGMLGEFYPYKYQGKKAEAIKLLNKKLLRAFVTEGALKPI